jgi:hypothetical protein
LRLELIAIQYNKGDKVLNNLTMLNILALKLKNNKSTTIYNKGDDYVGENKHFPPATKE